MGFGGGVSWDWWLVNIPSIDILVGGFKHVLFSISFMGCHPPTIDELHDFSRWAQPAPPTRLSLTIINHILTIINMEHHHFSMVIYTTSFPWPWTTGKNIRAEVFRSMPGDLQLLVAYGQFWLLKPTLWAMYVYIYWKNIATGSHKNSKYKEHKHGDFQSVVA